MAVSRANLKDVVAAILHVCACGIGVWCMCTCFMCICVCMSLLDRSEHKRRQRRTLVPTLPLSEGRLSHETWTSILSLRWAGLQVPEIPFLCLQDFPGLNGHAHHFIGCWASKFSSSCLYSDHSYPLGHLPSSTSESFKLCFPLQIDNWVYPAGSEQKNPLLLMNVNIF